MYNLIAVRSYIFHGICNARVLSRARESTLAKSRDDLLHNKLNRDFLCTFYRCKAINTFIQVYCFHVIRRGDHISRYYRTCGVRDVTGITG